MILNQDALLKALVSNIFQALEMGNFCASGIRPKPTGMIVCESAQDSCTEDEGKENKARDSTHSGKDLTKWYNSMCPM